MNLGSRIKFLREEQGLTQVELANLSGISRASIQLYEAEKVNIPVKNLAKIAKVLSVDADYFLSSNHNFFVKQEQNLSSKMSSNVKQPNKVSLSSPSIVPQSKILSPNMSRNQDGFKGHELEQLQRDQIFIRQLSSNVGAGESVDIDGVEVYDTEVLIPFSKMLFRLKPDVDKLRCMRVSGYSMIPMLYPDSWVIADINKEFKGDGLYIINYSGNFMVKLLQKAPDGTLEIISINKEYKSYEIGPDGDTQAYIVGKVLRCVI